LLQYSQICEQNAEVILKYPIDDNLREKTCVAVYDFLILKLCQKVLPEELTIKKPENQGNATKIEDRHFFF
jgi:hypothetical protein